jgi:hypothetical protein
LSFSSTYLMLQWLIYNPSNFRAPILPIMLEIDGFLCLFRCCSRGRTRVIRCPALPARGALPPLNIQRRRAAPDRASAASALHPPPAQAAPPSCSSRCSARLAPSLPEPLPFSCRTRSCSSPTQGRPALPHSKPRCQPPLARPALLLILLPLPGPPPTPRARAPLARTCRLAHPPLTLEHAAHPANHLPAAARVH